MIVVIAARFTVYRIIPTYNDTKHLNKYPKWRVMTIKNIVLNNIWTVSVYVETCHILL